MKYFTPIWLLISFLYFGDVLAQELPPLSALLPVPSAALPAPVVKPDPNQAIQDELDAFDNAEDSEGMGKVFKTSDLPNEKSTQRPKTGPLPPKKNRVGCICMDMTESYQLAGGSCAGHGGVRFWIYKTETGDTLHYATWRHKEHPDPLRENELHKLSAFQRYQRIKNDYLIDRALTWGIISLVTASVGLMVKKMAQLK
jgi:hypothetical protein